MASRLNELQVEACERFDMKKDDVLRFLASVVNVDPIDLLSSGKDTYMVKSVENIRIRPSMHTVN